MANFDQRTRRFVKTALVFAGVLLVVISAALAVPPADRGKPDRGQARSARSSEGEKKANPARACKAERETMGVSAFNERYGTNANKRNAFGKCVSMHAKEQAKKK